MIICRTPFRISFFGGGTDYPAWYRQHGGSVLVTTIDKYCYLACRLYPPFFDHQYRISYIKSENCRTIDEISHPAVRGVLKYLNWDRGLEIHHVADLPARGGMGSSSAFTVGLLNALYTLRGQLITKQELAKESVYIEQEVLKETVGSQDQTAATYGSFNHIEFCRSGDIAVRPVTIDISRMLELERHLMLFYTGIRRTAEDVAQSYVVDIEHKKAQMEALRDLLQEGVSLLYGSADISGFGPLLHEAWKVKRRFSQSVSNRDVDRMYEQAREAGATGGKILGAGGGGFMLLFVAPRLQQQVRSRLNQFIHVPFRFEHYGSQIIFHDRDQDYSAIEEERRSLPILDSREWSGAELH